MKQIKRYCFKCAEAPPEMTAAHLFVMMKDVYTVHCTAKQCIDWTTALQFTPLNCSALNCTPLTCTALDCPALHCNALHYTTLHFIAMNYNACTSLHCTTLQFTEPPCTAQKSTGPSTWDSKFCYVCCTLFKLVCTFPLFQRINNSLQPLPKILSRSFMSFSKCFEPFLAKV